MATKESPKLKKVAKASEAFEKQCQKFLALIDREEAEAAHVHFEMGVVVMAIEDDPRTYGQGAVDKLADLVHRDRSTLYDYGRVARCWSRRDFDALMSKKSTKGRPLSWSHMLAIAEAQVGAGDRFNKLRAEWIGAVLKEDLSVRALSKRIQRSINNENGSAVGRVDNPSDNGGSADGNGTPADNGDVTRPIDEGVRGIIALTEYSAQQSSRLASLPDRLSKETVQPGTLKKIPKVIEDLDAHIRWCSGLRDALQRKLEVQNEK